LSVKGITPKKPNQTSEFTKASGGTVKHPNIVLKTPEDVGKTLTIGVVAVEGEEVNGEALLHRDQEVANSSRGAHTNRVSKGDLVAPELHQLLRHLHHGGRGDEALVGAAHDARNVPTDQ